MEKMRVQYSGNEDMIPFDYDGIRYTFSKKTPIKEYPSEVINWLFSQQTRDWNRICKILPALDDTAKEEVKPEVVAKSGPKSRSKNKKGSK